MKRLLALMLCAVSFGVTAQLTYPYNPDGNADGSVALGDLLDVLTVYGSPFTPSEILVEGQTLTTVLTDLQHSIDSLSALSGGGGGSVLDMPLGTILPFASETVPEGWVLCDGRELAIEDYQDLYDLIGTTYGAGDSAFWAQVFYPATTFNIPDLRGRTIIGADDMGGESANTIQGLPNVLGKFGGEQNHVLTADEIPSQELMGSGQVLGGQGPASCCTGSGYVDASDGGVYWNLLPFVVNSNGGDQPHNNMQPYLALNYIMKVQTTEDVLEMVMAEMELIANDLVSVESTLSNVAQWLSAPEVVLFDFNEIGDFTPLTIEAGLSSTVVVEAVGDSGYSIGQLNLPSEDVPEGFVARVVNTNFHGQGGYGIDVQPISPNSNNGYVTKGRVASFVFVGGYWYPPAKIN